ncbi:GIY-YIG nuclease family protein [Agromyces aureus]|uniref:ATPase n=1 Tax=Agromyces aureus TaxID=453304 RepID=A0A191WB20_9MICO|nr:GIY-YIG nuclease family protein [Agromyces aureus]ANJ25461.1 ATPase [Agromyces aureus]
MDRADAAGPTCGLLDASGAACTAPVAAAAMRLCARHLLEAYELVAAEVGVTDLAPSACPACGCRVGVHYPSGWLCADCEWRLGEAPDGELQPVRVEVVYYVRYRDQVKIGTSANPRQRLASIPHDEVLAFEPGGRRLEQRRHAQFADHRFAGTEWFAAHDALAEHIAALALGVDDPWAAYDRWVSRRHAVRG